jgi:hypothetical protein
MKRKSVYLCAKASLKMMELKNSYGFARSEPKTVRREAFD